MYIHGGRYTKEYYAWQRIRYKCNNPKHRQYKHYGGRGIKVCERWNKSFLSFLEDMGYAPSNDLSIDRLNNDGDYEPGNCKWRTMTDQCNNTRNNYFITIDGERKTISQWGKSLGFRSLQRLYNIKWKLGEKSLINYINFFINNPTVDRNGKPQNIKYILSDKPGTKQ